jgi:hypothetical protein
MNIDPDALRRNDDPDAAQEDVHAGLPWNHCGRLDGHPGMVWYSSVRKTLGGDLKVGDWLDSLDHRGARMICAVRDDGPDSPVLTVVFSAGDTEQVRRDVDYDVVDPRSQVTPDGTPVATDDDAAVTLAPGEGWDQDADGWFGPDDTDEWQPGQCDQ